MPLRRNAAAISRPPTRRYGVVAFAPVVGWLIESFRDTHERHAFVAFALRRVLRLSCEECRPLAGFFLEHRSQAGPDADYWSPCSFRLDATTRAAWVAGGRERFEGYTKPVGVGVSTALFWALFERCPDQVHCHFPDVPALEGAVPASPVIARIGPAGVVAGDQLRGDTEWRWTWLEDCLETFARTRGVSATPSIGDSHAR